MEKSPLQEGFFYSAFAVEKMKDWFAPATEKDLEKFGIFSPPPYGYKVGVDPATGEDKTVKEIIAPISHKWYGRYVGDFHGIPMEDMKQSPDPIEEGESMLPDQKLPTEKFNKLIEEANQNVLTLHIFIGSPPRHKLIDTLKFPGEGNYAIYLNVHRAKKTVEEVLSNV